MMLTELFSHVLHMSLTATVVIAAVCLARIFLKRAPKIYSYLLWALVLFRLLCPVSLVASFSVIPDAVSSGAILAEWEDDYIGQTHTIYDNRSEFDTAVEAGRETFPAEEGHYYVVTGGDGISEPNTVENTLLPLLSKIWITGMLALILHSILSYARIRKQTRVAVLFRKGVFLADDVASPFVMGLIRPVIYLPGSLDPAERKYIIAHERHHIRRGDHIFKALGFLALTIHWFNPLVWVAFVLANRDMEMSCDEAVIRKYGEDVRADYSASLLNLATGHRLFTGTPLAFGEGDPTGRVRNLAKWKKPTFWVIVICSVLCAFLTVCLLTDPEDDFDWSSTRLDGPTSCALGDFHYTTPKGLAVQTTKINHEGNAADYGNEFYLGDTLVGGVIQRYQVSTNGLRPFTHEWEIALGIPEALDETMAHTIGSNKDLWYRTCRTLASLTDTEKGEFPIMLNIRDLKIDNASLGQKMLLVEVVPAYEYKDKQRTDTISGYRYVVCLVDHHLEKLNVRIDGPQLMEQPDGFVEVEFEGLEVRAYENKGVVNFTAKATGIYAV